MKYILVFMSFLASLSIAQDQSLIIKNTGNAIIIITPADSDGDLGCDIFHLGFCNWSYGNDNPCNSMLHNTYHDALTITQNQEYQIINGSELGDGWWSGGTKYRYCKYNVYNTNSGQMIGLRVSDYKRLTCVLTQQSGSINAQYDNNEVVNVANGTGNGSEDTSLCKKY